MNRISEKVLLAESPVFLQRLLLNKLVTDFAMFAGATDAVEAVQTG
jgi:hypothetical protein